MTPQGPGVTIVIPHWKGEGILRRCLASLRRTRYENFRILVVDNRCPDGSVETVLPDFPEVQVVRSEFNRGFAGGCNLGIRQVRTPWAVLLNNDTEVTPDWLSLLMAAGEADSRIAAVQPKMLSWFDRSRFDYCGAAGGEMDIFGYPFARGRLFDTMDTDRGQWQRPAQRDIFWATGAATLLRMDALRRTGLLEEAFFAHMEEIDLDWRLLWGGYRIVAEPEAVVYHQTAATLSGDSLRKMVLNHRNNLLMILRNLGPSTLAWLVPLRLILELATIPAFLLKGNPRRSAAVFLGLAGVIRLWPVVLRGRRRRAHLAQGRDAAKEGMILRLMARRSIAMDYFVRGVRTAEALLPGRQASSSTGQA